MKKIILTKAICYNGKDEDFEKGGAIEECHIMFSTVVGVYTDF